MTAPFAHGVQLADFGLTRVLDVDKRTHVSTQTYGTVAYMPPELLSSSRLTKAVRPPAMLASHSQGHDRDPQGMCCWACCQGGITPHSAHGYGLTVLVGACSVGRPEYRLRYEMLEICGSHIGIGACWLPSLVQQPHKHSISRCQKHRREPPQLGKW